MNTSTKSHKNRLPEWQSARMKSLIEERWSEIWKIVIAREHSTEDLDRHSLDSHRSSYFRGIEPIDTYVCDRDLLRKED